MSLSFAKEVVEELLSIGVQEFCVSSGKRNAFFLTLLNAVPSIKVHDWFEERSSAFFALGRARESKRPVAVVTTSGTAAGELLPAAMEAYYTGVPLILITSDRPRRFRGSGAPQSAEQKGIYGVYTPFALDLEEGEAISLAKWNRKTPLHLNICFEEPTPDTVSIEGTVPLKPRPFTPPLYPKPSVKRFQTFLDQVRNPLVVVSALPRNAQEPVVRFLQKMKAPVYCEGTSGIREREELAPYQLTRIENIWKRAEEADYPIDGILRIGGVPTFRPWRDLEEMEGKAALFSLSETPFSGISWGEVETAEIGPFTELARSLVYPDYPFSAFVEDDTGKEEEVSALFSKYPHSEAGMVHALSKFIPCNAHVYLGNSLPIREWDLAADRSPNRRRITANRGLNGIDGQLSTFFGECRPDRDNWAILGDLTTMYDMGAPWILRFLPEISVNIVVINNGGGKIFERLFPDPVFQNNHALDFEGFAKMWGLNYTRIREISKTVPQTPQNLIEVIPDEQQSKKFWEELKMICTTIPASSSM